MKKVLLQDIVIPAGTVFNEAPRRKEYYGEGHIEAVVGLSKNTSGSFTYSLDACDEAELARYFGDEGKEPPLTSDSSVIPSVVVDENDNVVETTICSSMSGGADEIGGMPREIWLTRERVPNGETISTGYFHMDVLRDIFVRGSQCVCSLFREDTPECSDGCQDTSS